MLTNMNEKILKILTAYIFMNQCKLNQLIYGHNCILQEKRNEPKANCRNKNLSDVPSDLNPEIRYLDLSKNKLLNLTDSSFLHLSNLISLEIREAEIGNEVTTNLFSPLTAIKYLDLSKTVFHEKDFEFKWPSNLYTLKLVRTEQNHLDLSNLENLQVLDASYNNLSKFPLINSKAPLQRLSLDWNSDLEVVSLETLASFRKLTTFSFKQTLSHKICSAVYKCQYIRLKQWMENWLMKGDLPQCPNITDETNCELLMSRVKRHETTPINIETTLAPSRVLTPQIHSRLSEEHEEPTSIIHFFKRLVKSFLKQIFVCMIIFIVLPAVLLIICLLFFCYFCLGTTRRSDEYYDEPYR